MTVKQQGKDLYLYTDLFDLGRTLDCGQCFRFEETADGSWTGITHFGRLTATDTGSGCVIFHDTDEYRFSEYIVPFFDLERDYGAVNDALCADPVLAAAVAHGRGIRIMRQPEWETVCSFIISQNNNIPRIKGIISRLCESFGTPLDPRRKAEGFAFPGPSALARLSTGDLAPLRAGFRDRYILDAARKFAEQSIDLALVRGGPLDQARAELMKIKGVGEKVADCALLFGFGRIEAFPRDVWIKRAMAALYPPGKNGGEPCLPACARPFAGIAQQYIFSYIRSHNGLGAAAV